MHKAELNRNIQMSSRNKFLISIIIISSFFPSSVQKIGLRMMYNLRLWRHLCRLDVINIDHYWYYAFAKQLRWKLSYGLRSRCRFMRCEWNIAFHHCYLLAEMANAACIVSSSLSSSFRKKKHNGNENNDYISYKMRTEMRCKNVSYIQKSDWNFAFSPMAM